MWNQIAISIQQGNPFLITILALGFFGSILLFERLIMLQLVFNIDFSKFLNNLKRSVQAEDLDRAVSLCKSASHTSLPLICLKALEAAERDPSTVRGTIEESTIDFLPRLETRIGMLPALSTLILLIGVLGTIDGLWQAFEAVEILDTTQKQARLANGITGSLNPTSLGLTICMIFLFGHQILRGLAITITERIHYGVAILNNLLVPQEIATYMPVAQQPYQEESVQNLPTETTETSETVEEDEDEDEGFDDASVEDIKDEEEII